MIQSYKQKLELEEHYDAIIIGSGMGSLTTAATNIINFFILRLL
jgi:all-trans-retinol 13,14-reductase